LLDPLRADRVGSARKSRVVSSVGRAGDS
jgi:hypothetical protein